MAKAKKEIKSKLDIEATPEEKILEKNGEGKTYVADTSIIIEKKVSELINDKKISGTILIPQAVLSELEHQANLNQTEGFLGLEEIKALRELANQEKIKLEFVGEKPKDYQIKGARIGAVDDLIRDIAVRRKACLITGDKVQSLIAEAIGVETILILPVPIRKIEALLIEKFFDSETMSIHLKENAVPLAKRGKPGSWHFEQLGKEKLTAHELRTFSADITEKTKLAEGAFVEITSPGISIIQFKNYRIVVCRPPFADGWELTIVRPIISLELEDYRLSRKLFDRLAKSATGILISGAPGSGKTTFAAALAKFYLKQNKIVKTIESPRDLQLPDDITQYSKNLGTRDDIHNVMLLTRPDYTIFDEMRTTEDFRLYADLRLAGIGLAGVVHATNPIDSVQRFVGKIEQGMIPQIIDTVIFIRDGFVERCFELLMKVKVPTGMVEADLARPVIEVKDFETGELNYEIYTYGEQTVVIPIGRRIKRSAEVETSFTGSNIGFKMHETGKFISFFLSSPARRVRMLASGTELATFTVPRNREIRIYRKSKLGRRILLACDKGEISFIV